MRRYESSPGVRTEAQSRGPLSGMRPRRCAQERDCADALASRFRVASPRAGPLLRRARAYLAVVRALPEADFADFPTDFGLLHQYWTRRFGPQYLSHELTGQDTSQAKTNQEEGA